MKKIIFLAIVTIIFSFYGFFIKAPNSFPVKKIIKIDRTLTAEEIGKMLKDSNIIQSPLLFKILSREKAKAGEYYFENKINIFDLINRLKNGEGGIPMIKITIPEGSNNEQIASILFSKIQNFNAPLFLKKAYKYQGYLFPDTYNIPFNANEDFVISLFRNTFKNKVKDIDEYTLSMAAVLEEEGSNKENRGMISDILWRRLENGMLLQVDVDRETYKKRGLPKMPITNPGLESIEAAKNPVKNSYLYYISDKDGIFHYAKTYEEHLVNISKYLKK